MVNRKNKPKTRRRAPRKGKQVAVKATSNPIVRVEPGILNTGNKSLGRGILNLIGTGLGGLVGGPGGAATGSSLANHVATFLGMGAYSVKSNSLVSNPPMAMHKASQDITVRHREYIGDITSSSSANTFTTSTYQLNPGLSATFPWLSQLAVLYQEYEFTGLIFEFVSSSADAIASSTNTTLGQVIMATVYRNSLSFLTKQQMNNEFFSNDNKPSVSFIHPIECDPKENPFAVQYVRSGPVPTNEDVKMYDLGTFNIASAGVQGTSVVLGELWCTYEVRLKKPVLVTPNGAYAHYNSTLAVTGAAPFYGMTLVTDNIGVTFGGTSTTLSLPLGTSATFVVVYYVVGDSTAVVPFTTFTGANGVTATLRGVAPDSGQTSRRIMHTVSLLVRNTVGVLPTFAPSGATLPANATSTDLWVFRITDPYA